MQVPFDKALLPFGFSSLVVLDPLGTSRNPLGLSSAQSRISRQVLPQFTVLTHHPRNHALLSGIVSALCDLNIKVDAREIRKAETLWGLAQTLRFNNVGGQQPLNIRRYQIVLDTFKNQNCIKLADVCQSRFGLMGRLGYGVWGFYARPSQAWRIINSGTRRLTDLGEPLGKGFNEHTGFGLLLGKWFSGRAISLPELPDVFAERSSLNTRELGRPEKSAWNNVFKTFIRRASKSRDTQIAEVWDALPRSSVIDKLVDEEKIYSSFFDELAKGLAPNSRLGIALQTQMHFERSACWMEFVFESLYLLAQLSEKLDPIHHSDWEMALSEAQKEIELYEKVRGDFGLQPALFIEVAHARNVNDFKRAILKVHNDVQERKGKGAYLDREGALVQEGAMNCDRARNALENRERGGFVNPVYVRYLYRRDWHYSKAARYKESFG